MSRVARAGSLALFLALAPALLPAGEAQERLDELLGVRLDAAQCWRIRDVFLEREDFKFYLNDGYLIFAEPYHGRDVAALFIAKEAIDFGELVLIPPTAGERQSLARFTGETVLNERFTSALMLFSDDTAAALRKQVEGGASAKADPAEGQALADRWTPVLRNILEGVSGRLMRDTLSDAPLESGFFAAAIGGGKHGRFDAVVDPQLHEQVSLGQTAWRAERRFYEIWCQFPSVSARSGKRQRQPESGTLTNYRLDVDLLPDLSMKAHAAATLVGRRPGYRTFGLEISSRLKVSALTVDGVPADFLQLHPASASASARHDNSLVFVVLPEGMKENEPLEVTMDYEGAIISRAGDNVFFVGSRDNWYPRAEPGFTQFDMTFRHPANLDLAATGKLIDQSVDGAIRTSHFRSTGPIRTAGFNLGAFAKTSRQVDGYTIEVLANRTIEERLRPPATTVILPDVGSPRRRGPLRPPSTIVVAPAAPSAPNPAARIEELADADADAFQFFRERFGPPPTDQVVISPIPAGFGQGFPGLVYAATLSYLKPTDPPLEKLQAGDRQFYLELLRPHEIAHQWWGNNVAIASGADLWMMEALATYSSLIYLEKNKGPQALRATLRDFQGHLLGRNQEDETIESAGPVALGDRLNMAKFPTAYRLILYEKGAWIFHMLRGSLGDEAFFGLLTDLSKTYRLRELSTEQLREAAAERLPKDYPDHGLHDFFDQWVYDTGIPRLKVEHRWRTAGDKSLVEGVLRQSGVPEHFAAPVKLRVEIEGRQPIDAVVWTDGDETPFQIEAPSKPARIVIDPDGALLAVKE